MKKQHGLKGKPGNRALPHDIKASSVITLRCIPGELSAWKEKASNQGISLSKFIKNSLNKSI